MESDKKTEWSTTSHNFILLFAGIAAGFFGAWKHSFLAALFLFSLEVWIAHTYAYICWDGRGIVSKGIVTRDPHQ